MTANTFIPLDATTARRRDTVSATERGLVLVMMLAGSRCARDSDSLVIVAPRAGSVVEPGLLDVVVVHAEVMRDLVQHRVVHLVDALGACSGPPFNVVLQQHDPLGVPRRAERRLGAALKVAEHTLVHPTSAVVIR